MLNKLYILHFSEATRQEHQSESLTRANWSHDTSRPISARFMPASATSLAAILFSRFPLNEKRLAARFSLCFARYLGPMFRKPCS